MKTVIILISLLIALVAFGNKARFDRTNYSGTMPDIKTVLKRLDDDIRRTNPKLYATLNPPLPEATLHALEVKYKVTLPPDLQALYLWKNGQSIGDETIAFIGNETFLPLEQALENRDMLNAEVTAETPEDHFKVPNWWHKDWIPVFENGGGDYTCYDPVGVFSNTKGQMLSYYHNEYYRSVMAPSLESWLQSVCLVYEKVYTDEWDSFQAVKGYPKSYDLPGRDDH